MHPTGYRVRPIRSAFERIVVTSDLLTSDLLKIVERAGEVVQKKA